MSDTDKSKASNDQDSVLRSLAYELKNPLITIARHAELAEEAGWAEVQATAEQALQLIDYYLLSARAEYGQVALELEPATVGSVLYDASQQLRHRVKAENVSLVIDDRTDGPIMTNRPALLAILSMFGNVLIGANKSGRHEEVILRGYKTRQGDLGIGLFTSAKLSSDDLRRALELHDSAHMPLARFNNVSHASLAIAHGLCRSIGGNLSAKQMGRHSGLATELPRSEQMAFV